MTTRRRRVTITFVAPVPPDPTLGHVMPRDYDRALLLLAVEALGNAGCSLADCRIDAAGRTGITDAGYQVDTWAPIDLHADALNDVRRATLIEADVLVAALADPAAVHTALTALIEAIPCSP